MISRWAAVLFVLAIPGVRADTGPVTVTPPLQVVPATPVSRNVQQRMRVCNTSADARKLSAAARETFLKSCMAPRRSHPGSRPGSQPKPNP
jgi:psiF repeat